MARTRDEILNHFMSLSCQEGQHERCTLGPRPMGSDEIAPRCTCEHHLPPASNEIIVVATLPGTSNDEFPDGWDPSGFVDLNND